MRDDVCRRDAVGLLYSGTEGYCAYNIDEGGSGAHWMAAGRVVALPDVAFSVIEQMVFLGITKGCSLDLALALYGLHAGRGIDCSQLTALLLYYDFGRGSVLSLETVIFGKSIVLPAQGPLPCDGFKWPTMEACRAKVEAYVASPH